MLYEFAVEPGILYTAARSRRDYRDFMRWFEIGEPNVISNYPVYKKLKNEVLKGQPEDLSDKDQSRLEELIKYIGDTLRVKRIAIYDRGRPWLDNIKDEEKHSHFDYVLTSCNDNALSCLTVKQLFEGRVNHPRQLPVRRIADKMEEAIQNMLRLSSEIVFIDPYFKAFFTSWDPFIKFVKAALRDTPCNQLDIRVLYNSAAPRSPSAHSLAKKFRDEQHEIVSNCNVSFISIREIEGKEKIHNRYILTDIGGLFFGIGLTEENESHQDDVSLLNSELYNLRWEQYACLKDFKVVESEVV